MANSLSQQHAERYIRYADAGTFNVECASIQPRVTFDFEQLRHDVIPTVDTEIHTRPTVSHLPNVEIVKVSEINHYQQAS